MNLQTKLIHAGEPQPRIYGAVSMPIFQTAMYEYEEVSSYHDIKYIRLNNTPNHAVLHAKLAAIENAEAALVTSSGMAAISAALLTILKSGDHLLAQNCLYGGTHDFITKDFPSLGIEFDFIDGQLPDTWKSRLRSNTKAIYVESITNPLMQVADLKALVSFAEQNNLITLIDNTFATPVNFRPCEIGFHLSLHSCTKYLNGHSDIVAGAVIGSRALIEKITRKLNHFGGSLDPHACFLLHRGIKTLALRVNHQNQSALNLAEFLENHPAVKKVNYPGLNTDSTPNPAKELFSGFGGMLSFELKGGIGAAEKLIKNLQLPIYAPSLGGVESLITIPALTSHSGMSRHDRMELGITDDLLRVSVGIESPEDLIQDFNQALEAL